MNQLRNPRKCWLNADERSEEASALPTDELYGIMRGFVLQNWGKLSKLPLLVDLMFWRWKGPSVNSKLFVSCKFLPSPSFLFSSSWLYVAFVLSWLLINSRDDEVLLVTRDEDGDANNNLGLVNFIWDTLFVAKLDDGEVCNRTCLFKLLGSLNDRPQWQQLSGFSPVCVRICILRPYLRVYTLPIQKMLSFRKRLNQWLTAILAVVQPSIVIMICGRDRRFIGIASVHGDCRWYIARWFGDLWWITFSITDHRRCSVIVFGPLHQVFPVQTCNVVVVLRSCLVSASELAVDTIESNMYFEWIRLCKL